MRDKCENCKYNKHNQERNAEDAYCTIYKKTFEIDDFCKNFEECE